MMAGPGSLRRSLSGILFVVALLISPAVDLANLRKFAAGYGAYVTPETRPLVPHLIFHALTPVVGLGLVALLLTAVVVRGPYRRGEAWAWWTLVLAGAVLLAVKLWGTLTIYAHHILGGLTVELELPFLLWLLAVGLSWREFR